MFYTTIAFVLIFAFSSFFGNLLCTIVLGLLALSFTIAFIFGLCLLWKYYPSHEQYVRNCEIIRNSYSPLTDALYHVSQTENLNLSVYWAHFSSYDYLKIHPEILEKYEHIRNIIIRVDEAQLWVEAYESENTKYLLIRKILFSY